MLDSMVEKTTIRNSDRRKLNSHKKIILDHYGSYLKSEPYCNRCKKVIPLKNLEIHHLTYQNESYRYGELVCRDCHIDIEKSKLPSFNDIKHIPPKTVFVFQKFLSGIAIVSKLEDGRIIQRAQLRLRAGEEVNPVILLGIFTNNHL